MLFARRNISIDTIDRAACASRKASSSFGVECASTRVGPSLNRGKAAVYKRKKGPKLCASYLRRSTGARHRQANYSRSDVSSWTRWKESSLSKGGKNPIYRELNVYLATLYAPAETYARFYIYRFAHRSLACR